MPSRTRSPHLPCSPHCIGRARQHRFEPRQNAGGIGTLRARNLRALRRNFSPCLGAPQYGLRSNSEERDSESKYRARRASSETQDFHPGRRSVPRGLRSRPPLVVCLKATIQGRSPGFQPKLIPVRSPLLRESCLVPFPPLTYMLKFGGFTCLTSC